MLKTNAYFVNALGALNFQGTWNAATNTPTLTSGVGVKGDYYVVAVAGTTNLDGETLWGVGDWATFNGTVWQKVDGGSTGNFTTISVNTLATLAGVNFTTSTAASATFETSSLPLVPQGYIEIQVGGAAKKIPFYAT